MASTIQASQSMDDIDRSKFYKELGQNIHQFMNLSLAIYLADYKLKYRTDLKDAILRAKASTQALLKTYDLCLAAHVHPTISTLSAIVRSAGRNVICGLDKVNEASKTIFVASEENMEEALSAVKKGIWTFSNWRNGLFAPEEIIRINHSLHFSQPLKVVLEILNTPNTCFLIACLALTVYSQVIIPIVEIMNMFPALCGYGVSDSGVSAILPPQGVQCIAPDSGPISKKTFHNPSIPSTEIGFST
ncbi:hypothetical protein RJ640_015854 [Escallonia rubra]|uniref:Uncharacterized protein n=1 Tax=Escallonia rubra TaxID=112253 RepID=A0AA88UHU6_9ASTE|nr:hypothetical protein RJ640_015854 [Escallonia rubra]